MATVFVLFLCSGIIFPNFVPVGGISHWVVTEDGRIQAQLDSVFNMRRPYDLMSLLKQDERADMLEELKQELIARKHEIDSNEDKDTGLEQRFYKTDPDCVAAEKPLPEFDLYISTVLPLENKGIRPEEHIDFNANPTTMPMAPDCSEVGVELDFSMHAFEHLQGMKERANLSGSQELGLKNAIAHRDNVDDYGHLVYEALLKNNTSWVLYNMAAFYWRIKGYPYHVVECVRRALHFSPRMHKDVALISLANVLHRAHYSNEAAVVVHAAIDVSKELNVNHFTLGNIYAVLRDYNKSVICFENTLSIQPDFEAAAKRKHAVRCHAKLEEALEKQHKSLQRTLDDLKDYQKKHTHWQQQQERLISEQASPDTKMEQRVTYEQFLSREIDVAMGYGEFCKEVPEGIWCGWDKKHVTLTDDDFRPMDGLLPGDGGIGSDVIDYSVPKHEPRYTVKHPPVPESLREASFRGPEWPSKDECDTYVVKFPAWNEFPTTYLSPENKGYEVKPLLAEAQGLAKGDEHPLPWYPPICATLTDIPEGPRSYDHIQSVKERTQIPLKLYDTSMKQALLEHVEARDLTEEEVGQRIMTALKKKIGPSWVLYNLAGLYWRIIGNSYHGVECIRRSLYYAPDEYRDVPLVNLANILYKWGRVDDAVVVMRDAIAINDLEPDTHFFLGSLLAAKGNLSGSIHHYEEAMAQNALHKEALESLRIIKCYQKFHRSAQSAAPKHSASTTDLNKCGGQPAPEAGGDPKVFCKNDNGRETCMVETSQGDCEMCKQMCSVTPMKVDGCQPVSTDGKSCAANGGSPSAPRLVPQEFIERVQKLREQYEQIKVDSRSTQDMLERLQSGVSEEMFHSLAGEQAEQCGEQKLPLMPNINNPLDDPELSARLEETMEYYRQKGVCSGDDCAKLMIQCFSPVSSSKDEGVFFVKNQPIYVYKKKDSNPEIQTCKPVGLPPSHTIMLANMPMPSQKSKPHTKLEIVNGVLHQNILFVENYEDIEFEPEECIIFNHGERTPGCNRDEYRPFDFDDPSSFAMHPIHFHFKNGKAHKTVVTKAPTSAEHAFDHPATMTTEELTAILDKLQRDLEEEKLRYQESIRKQLELDKLRYQHADDDFSHSSGLQMTDEEIIRTDPDPTRNINTLPTTQWPEFEWCKHNRRDYSFLQFASTWVSVTTKGVDVSEFVDFDYEPPLSATPICDASLLQDDLPMDQIQQLSEPHTLSYKPEGGLKEAFQSLNKKKSETVQQVGTRVAYALHKNPKSWVLASLAALHWRIAGRASEAITCSKLAYQHAPDHAKDIPLLSLANILHSAGQLKEALKLTNAALERAPDVVAIHFATANLYAAQKDWAKATQFYHSTLALQSTLLPALERLLVIQCERVLSNPHIYRDQPPANTYNPDPVLAGLRRHAEAVSPTVSAVPKKKRKNNK